MNAWKMTGQSLPTRAERKGVLTKSRNLRRVAVSKGQTGIAFTVSCTIPVGCPKRGPIASTQSWTSRPRCPNAPRAYGGIVISVLVLEDPQLAPACVRGNCHQHTAGGHFQFRTRVRAGELLAERRLGEMLAEMPLAGRNGGDTKSSNATLLGRLTDLGISRMQSHRWQLEAVGCLTAAAWGAIIRTLKAETRVEFSNDHVHAEREETSSPGFEVFRKGTHAASTRRQ